MAWKFFTAQGQEKQISSGGVAVPGFVQLYDSVLAAPAASFDVSSISQAYNHLLIEVMGRSDAANVSWSFNLRLNNDSAANYDYQRLSGQAGTASSVETFAGTAFQGLIFPGSTATAGVSSYASIKIQAYKETTFNKVVRMSGGWKGGTTTGLMETEEVTGFWRNSAAINRITIFPGSGNLIAGSHISIYGIN